MPIFAPTGRASGSGRKLQCNESTILVYQLYTKINVFILKIGSDWNLIRVNSEKKSQVLANFLNRK